MGILHVCGGDPRELMALKSSYLYSPRMWRWSCQWGSKEWLLLVFSTYVEVIPECAQCHLCEYCILHVCGGDPESCRIWWKAYRYSPRMWRWSYQLDRKSLCGHCILHVCGGDPKPRLPSWSTVMYSPRMWRWSCYFQVLAISLDVFSTYVEVILARYRSKRNDYCILHTCWECYCPWAHR